ncbi:MAG: hypothetical protein ACOVP4_06450 [Bacteriovoracaceae bacterium]|jgi:hypothetical protein
MKTFITVMVLIFSFSVLAEENMASDCHLTRDDINTRHNPKANLESVKTKQVKPTATAQ